MAESDLESSFGEMSREEMMSALFAQMVIQQANMAMMLLGKVPHPQTGQTVQDIEGAKMFIDQLEMLEAKTKGNLNPDEANLLKQSLMSLRLAFVETVESPAKPPPKESPASAPEASAQVGETKSAPAVEPAPAADESKKKFSKKY